MSINQNKLITFKITFKKLKLSHIFIAFIISALFMITYEQIALRIDSEPTNAGSNQGAIYEYDSVSQFSVWIPAEKGEEIRFILRREGINWKLENILLPESD